MADPASIATLPAELHIAIAELVENESFHALRLASRDFATNSIDVFAERLFNHQDTWTAHAGIHGVRKLLKKIWPWASRADFRAGDIDGATDAFLAALAKTDHTVNILDLAYNSRKKLKELSPEWKKDSVQAKTLAKVFSNLVDFKIGLGSPCIVTDMGRMLQAATNLITFSVNPEEGAFLLEFPDIDWRKLLLVNMVFPPPSNDLTPPVTYLELAIKQEWTFVGVTAAGDCIFALSKTLPLLTLALSSLGGGT